MILYSSGSHLRCTLLRAFKTTNHLLSRSLTIQIHQFTSNRDHIDPSYNFLTFTNNEQPSNPADLDLVGQLRQHGSLSNPYFLNKVVSFCAKFASFDFGTQLHSSIIKMGFVSNLYISSALVDLYAKCGQISCAQILFDEMPEKNVVSWNSLISGYLNVNFPEIAVKLFIKMLRMGITLTPFSVSGCLMCCLQLGDGEFGAQIHGLSLKAGFACNVVVGTSLINMYSKCCTVDDSRQVFDYMVDKNVIAWTSMLTAYAQYEQPDEAMTLVIEMMRLGLKPNHVTFNTLLSSFSGSDYLDCCKQVHCCIIQQGLESNEYIAVTLVTVYSKCSDSFEDFKKVCSSVTTNDQASRNAVVAGYYNLGYFEDALKCFCEMRQAGISVDFYTFTIVLGAIGNISSLEEGKEMHALILRTGYASNVDVQNGLISMYARCGVINDSKKVFWLMEEHNVISWNALLTGCAHHGYGSEAVDLFEQMRKTDIKPNSSTFLVVLSACSHAGLVDKGLEYFDMMRNEVSLEPLRAEHYASAVDIFGRAGYLNEAEAFINSMIMEPGPSVYKALLSACLVHGNKEIAARSAKKLLERWPNDPPTYVLLSSVLTTGGSWDDAANVRKLMCDRGLRKKPGCSWT